MPELPRARTSLIETVRVCGGRVPLWPLHLDRLHRSAAALGYTVPPDPAPPSGGGDRVCRLEFASRARLLVTERQVEEVAGLRLRTSPVPHRGYRHKTTNREWLDAGRLDAVTRGGDDALFPSAEGFVAESSIWSLFWWEGGDVAAPPLELGILPGVARARLVEVLGGVREGLLPVAALAMHGGFAANAARGIVPLVEVDGVQVVPNRGLAPLREAFWP
ncbi:MAG TPA: aminotransferase class IV [Gemmatimonadales bacterium]|nr:aminotransferase class IV [Gemmatimonadales bacterium]